VIQRSYVHESGDDKGGCSACQDEATDCYLNGGEAWPACTTPQDDGDGSCDVCGHAVREALTDL
jgi:hypothetical protein